MSPYKERTREFWKKVAGEKCQYEFYTEGKGWQQCNAPATQVHHIIGEGETLEAGEDPERNVALPLCKNHHIKNRGDTIGEWDSSFHPDMGEAFEKYPEWKDQQSHMNSISGKKTIDYSTSPFVEAAKGHKTKREEGQRYISGDDGTDNYYLDKMRSKAVIYEAKTGERKPDTSPHPRTDTTKKKKWYNIF